MVVIIDFHHIFPDVQKRERSTFEDDVARMIEYYLYREFFIDTGTYSLDNRLLGKYCKKLMDISTHCRSIGEVAWRHRYRRSIIRIRNRDAYAILLKEASYD
jgi:hypothetical protein